MRIFYPEGPRPDREMSDEEKSRRTRSFRRKAALTDICLILFAALAVFYETFQRSSWAWPIFCCTALPLVPAFAAGCFLTYRRCPFCGQGIRSDWTFRPLLWRFFCCPDCGFTPKRDKTRSTHH